MPGDPYWNHNTHYHPWLLRQIPDTARTAVDIGCGDGLLAHKLAEHPLRVLGVDRDPDILEYTPDGPRLRFECSDFRHLNGSFDVVTAVASLHHVPLVDGLATLRRLVVPGGLLLVVGMWRMSLGADLTYLPLLPAIWAVETRHRRATVPAAPVREPTDTFARIRAAAAETLPGAQIRRRLLWRYTLRWHAPA